MIRLTAWMIVVFCVAGAANAQSAPERPRSPTLEAPPPSLNEPSMPALMLGALPSTSSLYSLIETIPPDVVSHRIDGGGMYSGSAARIGAHGSSWTQTLFRVGDINITAPEGSGTPLALPGAFEWESADVNTGIVNSDTNTPGIVVSLTPRRPSATWLRQLEITGGPPFMQFGGSTPPPIARLHSYGNSSLVLSGPLTKHLGVMFTGTYARASRFERDSQTPLNGGVGSAFTHLVYNASPRDQVRTVLWVQRSTAPVDHPLTYQNPGAQGSATSLSLQTTWERKGAAGAPSWRGYAAVTGRKRFDDDARVKVLSIERLNEPPAWEQIYPGPGAEQVWQIGGTMSWPFFERLQRQHHVTTGLDLSRGSASQTQWFNGQIGELINGIPARVWDFSSPGSPSRWRQTTFALHAADRFMLRPRLSGTAGLRVEHVGASADGAATGVSWTTLLPRIGVKWDLTEDGRLAWISNYARYAHQMRLRDLAYGDPNAASANVYKWNAPIGTTIPQASAIGPLVERWGPGSGTSNLTAIDPDLERPHMHEIVIGFEYRPAPKWVGRISGIARIDRGQLAVTNTGVPFSAYTKSVVIDPGVDIVGGSTVQPLPIYDRPASTFGNDRYLLTNDQDIRSNFSGVDVSLRRVGPRLVIFAGGTAGRSEGWASNRGFRYNENDTSVLGEVFADPNANTFAKGRTFTERGYTAKASGAAAFPHAITLGVAARYQDGQHFSRMVVAPDLSQGAELVRAFANGETRFTFLCTVDARLQKGFVLAGHHVDVMLDVFNMLGPHNEVEEITVTGPTSRQSSALQPPPAFHLGVRIPF